MSILSQCCGLVILVAVLYFYSFRKKIHIRTGQSFLWLVVVTFISLTFDIASIFCIEQLDSNDMPLLFVNIVCKTYIVTLMSVAMCGLAYICSDIYNKEKLRKKVARILSVIWALMAILIYALPIYIHRNEYGVAVYTEGPSTIATYSCVGVLVITIIVVLEINRKKINPGRKSAVYFWIGVWTVSAIIQFINSEILIVGFGAAVGDLVIYLALENPESNIDRKTGFFNENALALYANQQFSFNSAFSLICLRIQSLSGMVNKMTIEEGIVNEVNDYLESFEKADVFVINDNEVAMAFENAEYARDALELIEERFHYGWGEKKTVMLPAKIMFVENSLDFSDWESISHATKFVNYKTQGTNSSNDVIIVSSETMEGIIKELEVTEVIRDAIENDRVEVFYQPIYSAKTGKFSSAEALARIRTKDGTLVPPGLFIPIAEKNGTIIKIGEIVFEKVCRLLSREMLHERFDLDYVEVNLSTIQCAYEGLSDTFISIMNKNHVDPTWINLEITETGSVAEKNILLHNMKELKLYGVNFSLDDFGTGNSNLNYVLDMPVDIVKFDREMTNAYFRDDRSNHIMSKTIEMLRDLNLEIVAEGVETKEQAEAILALNVEFIQGFYYSKPLPRGDFVNFLENENLTRTSRHFQKS